MGAEDRSDADWAALLRESWEERSRSEARDFYVASHPGWRDEERWREQAGIDAALMLHGLEAAALAGMELLEIGCGVGRLALPLASRVRGYTGVDIAPGMVEEARRRCASLPNARFFESDGLGVPAEAADRAYQLVLAMAVFIHCPRPVIASLVRSAYALLSPGGQLRFQVLADPADPTGLESAEEAAVVHEEAVEMEAGAGEEERELIDGRYYMGDAFRYDELGPFLEEASGGGEVTTFRPDLGHAYGWIEKPRG